MNEATKAQLNLLNAETFFWDNYPHETSWGELKEINPDLFARLMNIGQALVLIGKLNSSHLPKGKK